MKYFLKQFLFLRELKKFSREKATQGEPLSVMDDIVFKAMLTSDTEDSREALRNLLAACTHRKVSKVKVLNSEILPAHLGAKTPRLDIKVIFNDGEIANLEMQFCKTADDLKDRHEKHAESLIYELCQKEEGIMRAENEVLKIDRSFLRYIRKMDEVKDKLDRIYELENARVEGHNMGHAEGKAEGFIEGKNIGEVKLRNELLELLNMNISIEDIKLFLETKSGS